MLRPGARVGLEWVLRLMHARGWLIGTGVAAAAAGLVTLGLLGHQVNLAANRVAAPAGAAVSATVDAPPDAVQRVLAQGKPVVAEFGANVCAACREMKPVLAQLAREHGDRLEVVDVDLVADRQAGYLQRYRIQLMPTQIFYDAQGREIGRHMGPIGADAILARLGLAAADPADAEREP